MNNRILYCSLYTLKSLCKRPFLILLFFLIFFSSCKHQQKITLNNGKCLLDFKNTKTLTSNLKSNEFRFEKLNAKLNVDAMIDSSSYSFAVHLRIKKDSVIWMSINKIGIEIAKVLITKDSVKFTNTINKQYFKGDFSYISKLLNSDLDYEILQSLLVGNSVEFYDEDEKIKPGIDNCQYTLGTIRKYKLRRVMGHGKELKEPAQSIYMIPETFKISRILFYEFNPERSFDARFGNYEMADSTQWFPKSMSYAIKAQKTVSINIEYANIKLNEEKSFPFKIPDSYEKIIFKERQ